MLERLAGRWDGLMHDVEGMTARCSLDLHGSDELRGAFTFQLTGDHCAEPEQKGEVHGRATPGREVVLDTRMEDGSAIRFRGKVYEVRHHARAAICGTYEVEGQEPARGGTAIFWLYADNLADKD